MALYVRLAAIILGLAAVSPALAQQRPDRNCADDTAVDRCAAEQQARQRATFGMRPIEAIATPGTGSDDLLRRRLWTRSGRDRLRPGARPRSRSPGPFPRRDGRGGARAAGGKRPAAGLGDILLRSAHFDLCARVPPVPTRAPPPSACTLGLHGRGDRSAPSPNQPAGLRRVTEDLSARSRPELCGRDARAAFARVSGLRRLDSGSIAIMAAQLAACRLLSGDRMRPTQV